MRTLLGALVVAVLWAATVHLFFRIEPRELVTPLTEELRVAKRELLQRSNPEWDLMARTFTVLAFVRQANTRPELLTDVDTILDETLAMDAARADAFVMPYFHDKAFVDAKTKSLFVDGEVALMLAARLRVSDVPRFREPLHERIERLTAAMQRGSVLSAESYPDEAWTFCNTVALAATRLADDVEGTDHSQLRRAWVTQAKRSLVDPKTGLLVSSFTWRGEALDGPEGSTIFLAAHMLQFVDDAFAREQYDRAKSQLAGQLFGFGWSAEWPKAWKGRDDIDSGPTVPIVDANAGASGLALVGAAAFGDDEWLNGLVTSLRFAAFPISKNGRLRFAAGNTLADAVLLYAAVLSTEGAAS
ncbi:MAG: hypothetical protein ACO1OB_20435 [Archangium sp.]